jgi:hypothetical protein
MAPPQILRQRARGAERKHILIPVLIDAAPPRRIPISRYTKYERLNAPSVTDLWRRVQTELRLSGPELATALTRSPAEVERWSSGLEPAPASVHALLVRMLEPDSVWRQAILDRPKATRVRRAGGLELWVLRALLVLLLPILPILLFYAVMFAMIGLPDDQWLITLYVACWALLAYGGLRKLRRRRGYSCSLCGEQLRRSDAECPGCEAELV